MKFFWKPGEAPRTPTPPPPPPPPRREGPPFKAELLHQCISAGIRETDGIYEIKPLNTTVPISTTLMEGPFLGFGGHGYVNRDGTYKFWGKVRKEFTTYDACYEGTINQGQTLKLDGKFIGSSLFGVQLTVGEELSLRIS